MLSIENFVPVGSENSIPSKPFGYQHNIKTTQPEFSLVLDATFLAKRNRSTFISLKFFIISFVCEIKQNEVCKFRLLFEISLQYHLGIPNRKDSNASCRFPYTVYNIPSLSRINIRGLIQATKTHERLDKSRDLSVRTILRHCSNLKRECPVVKRRMDGLVR